VKFPELDEYIQMQKRTVATNVQAVKDSKKHLAVLLRHKRNLEKKYK
jgi:hypothetical protein